MSTQAERAQAVLKERNITEKDILYLKMALKHTLESLEEYGASILPHLTDTDQNSGEQLRYFMYKCGIGDMKGIKRSSYSQE
jgi:hypothetical protein